MDLSVTGSGCLFFFLFGGRTELGSVDDIPLGEALGRFAGGDSSDGEFVCDRKHQNWFDM